MTDQPRAQIQTLIFDAEGVVIDTEALWDDVQRELLARHGRVYDREAVKSLIAGRSSAEGIRILQQVFDIAGDPDELAAERMEIAREHFDRVDYVEGFEPFFAEVSSQFTTAMATAMDPTLLRLADARLGLTSLFAGRVSTVADVAGRGKPAPDLFLHAASAAGSPPEQCVVFEDAPNGVEAAHRAGMTCIAITTTFAAESLADADLVVDAFADIAVDALRRFPAP